MWGDGQGNYYKKLIMLLRELMENLGTASFAISGALAALNKRLDVFGRHPCWEVRSILFLLPGIWLRL
jgi:hypothetical protein